LVLPTTLPSVKTSRTSGNVTSMYSLDTARASSDCAGTHVMLAPPEQLV
jgi:hypothetical protein